MILRFLYPLALGVALMVAVPGSLTAQSSGGTDVGLQPGDLVQITVWMREELSGEFTVAPDGSLNHPLYRQVRVTGVPASQIEERLRSFLSAFEANPQVVVQPLYRVTVAGSVMRPDIYNLAPGTTVAQAVTHAGGVTETGKRDDVRVFRDANEMRLDLTEPEAIQMPVQSGDQVLVSSKSSGGGLRTYLLPVVQIGLSIANLMRR
jgi:polysaccharide export outer membrane protein